MAETINIAKLAEIISKDIFKWLKWGQNSLFDVNYECVQEGHNKKTHPADTVFNYLDPYTGKRVYIHTDLKSYKNQSITKASVESALKSLAMSVECAHLSKDWQDKFVEFDDEDFEITGLLFIYNHDSEYDKDFSTVLSSIKNKNLKIKEGQKIVVFSPETVIYLFNIVTDLKGLCADDVIPKVSDITYFYPDLALRRRHAGDEWGHAASIEYLTAPWLLIKHKPVNKEDMEGYIIYYRERGESIDEFVYLIDTLSAYQLLSDDNKIRIRLFNSHESAVINFNKAKKQYLQSWGFDETKSRHLDYIDIGSINTVASKYNTLEVGMRDE